MVYLKYFFLFLLSFLIFSIPISNRPLFYHIYDIFSPATRKLYTFIKNEGEEKIKEGKKASVEMILEKVPEKIKKIEIPKSEEPLSIEEKEMLEQIL